MIDADSLAYLSVEGVKALRLTPDVNSAGCFTGNTQYRHRKRPPKIVIRQNRADSFWLT